MRQSVSARVRCGNGDPNASLPRATPACVNEVAKSPGATERREKPAAHEHEYGHATSCFVSSGARRNGNASRHPMQKTYWFQPTTIGKMNIPYPSGNKGTRTHMPQPRCPLTYVRKFDNIIRISLHSNAMFYQQAGLILEDDFQARMHIIL
ncbi:hypothetical protein [Oceanidesulfovibrio marinus]|uniref:Uncharacterized protein n=1 Tax=Oceanidesulfovibrio marinus TaxID=370038 RepID=A0ABX6NBK1_9BACT|nr:hypothetical protein [Oceanidesulfovibrio marinus]QJT07967.1 hypothetical protein E8L03_03060 [Oceanidesulfovibrio marinus]